MADADFVQLPDGRIATQLECMVDAAVASMSAWVYPSDLEIRNVAEYACDVVGINYVESLAAMVEASDKDDAPMRARWGVVTACMDGIAQLAAQGARPREGFACTGQPVNLLGVVPKPEEDAL